MNKTRTSPNFLLLSFILLILGCSTPTPQQSICEQTEAVSHPAKSKPVSETILKQIILDNAISPTGEFLYEFKHKFSAVKHPVVVRIHTRIRFTEPIPNLRFVTSLREDNRDVFWEGHVPLRALENPGEWHNLEFEVRLPQNLTQNNQLVTYLWNPEQIPFDIEYFDITIESEVVPSFLPKAQSPNISGDFEIVTETERVQILFYSQNGHLVLADKQSRPLTRAIGWTMEYSIDDLNYSCQQFTWQLDSQNDGIVKLSGNLHAGDSPTNLSLQISKQRDSEELHFHLEAIVNSNLALQRLAMNIQFEESFEQIFDAYGNEHRHPRSGEFHLPKGGFISGAGNRSISVYHATGLSSIQLNAAENRALFNVDYQWDHPMMHFPLHADSSDYFVDQSAANAKAGQKISASIPFFIGSGSKTLPRFLSVPGGYNAAFVFTEHSDWTNMQTHRAVCFGHEDVRTADAATGGFVKYNIPVTKSVFYDNPDSVVNTRASDSLFTDLHSSIQTDSEFLPFLKLLEKQGFEICLHTPAQYTDTREQTQEALHFMQQEFGSPTWIDHGYNNAPINNRENVVCDGLKKDTPHYARDLWEQNEVRYFWHPYYEDDPVFSPWSFSTHLQLPYPGFGVGFPYFPIARHPDFNEALLWYTTNLTAPPDEGMWDYAFSPERLSELVQNKGIYISHTYPAWVKAGKGFWVFDEEGKIVANPGFNRALERIAQLRDDKLILPTTISVLLTYYEAIDKVEYHITGSNSVTLNNTGESTIQDLSMVLSAKDVTINGTSPQTRVHDGELIFWFDLPAGESVQVEWK